VVGWRCVSFSQIRRAMLAPIVAFVELLARSELAVALNVAYAAVGKVRVPESEANSDIEMLDDFDDFAAA
jgi:hypothetical protein